MNMKTETLDISLPNLFADSLVLQIEEFRESNFVNWFVKRENIFRNNLTDIPGWTSWTVVVEVRDG